MIHIKNEEEIAIMREGGRRLGAILARLAVAAVPGATTTELNDLAEHLTREGGDIPAFLDYTPDGAPRPYPAALCVSVNDEVVHGIPNENSKVLKEGDIVALDMGLIHRGFVTDSAVTVAIGEADQKALDIIRVTEGSLMAGIAAVRDGATVGNIGHAIQEYVRPHGYAIFTELGGHGVGRHVHEDPHIPNFGRKGQGVKLKAGMTIAIEPMLGEGSARIYLAKDGYTYKTKDGSRATHFEHTIVVTENGSEILTSR
jgi:methionyl aminopeptidase